MNAGKVNKRVFYGVFIFTVLIFGFIAFKLYQNYNRAFQGGFSASNLTIIEKEITREDGEEVFWVTIKQALSGQEYSFHVAFSDRIGEKNQLYNALFTDMDYNVITYENNIPQRIAVQNGVAPNGGFDLYKFLDNYELTEKYMKLKSIGAQQ